MKTFREVYFRKTMIQSQLSDREIQVAELTIKGLTNEETSNELLISEKTVKFHLTNIYKKLNVTSRAQLIVLANKPAHEAPPVDTLVILPRGRAA